MATVKTTMYQIQNNDLPGQKTEIGDYIGRQRSIFFEHTWAADVNAIGDILKLFKLPAGARVLDYHVAWPSAGTTGIGHIGWAASTDGVEEADADGFGVSLDAGGQAATANRMDSSVAGFCKRFSSQVDVQLELTEATDASEGDIIKGYFTYVID